MVDNEDKKKTISITVAEDERLQALAPDYLQGERAISRRVQWALGLFFAKTEAERITASN